MAALLQHLCAQGFTGAPRFLGRDEEGRASLSYLTGDVPARFRRFADEQVHAAGALLRAFHEATRDCTLAAGSPVVCHGDPGPHNTVFRDGGPVAFIDFDLAGPGHPMQDLGYMAWTWCISSKPERGPVSFQAHQIRILAEAYGIPRQQRAAIIDAILERLDWNIGFWCQSDDEFVASGNIVPTPERVAEIIDWTRREKSFVEQHRIEIVGALA
ncbi:MAG: aminoglycoside phosphotransferase family protein [Gammaproteobacteria bacterium]